MVVEPEPVIETMAEWWVQSRQRGKPQQRERLILRYGLSPWSRATVCDWCQSVPGYLRKAKLVGVAVQPLGRWMLHPACQQQAKAEGVTAVGLPPLDYGPLAELPPTVRVDLMKIYLLEQTNDLGALT